MSLDIFTFCFIWKAPNKTIIFEFKILLRYFEKDVRKKHKKLRTEQKHWRSSKYKANEHRNSLALKH